MVSRGVLITQAATERAERIRRLGGVYPCDDALWEQQKNTPFHTAMMARMARATAEWEALIRADERTHIEARIEALMPSGPPPSDDGAHRAHLAWVDALSEALRVLAGLAAGPPPQEDA